MIDLHLKYAKNPFNFHKHITKPTDSTPQQRMELEKMLAQCDHPVMVAIRQEDRETLDKLLAHELPIHHEKIFKRRFLTELDRSGLSLPEGGIWAYLYGFWAKKDQAERRILRQKLYEAIKQGDQKQKEEIIEKLAGRKVTNYDGTISHREDPLRKQEADEYKFLRRKFDSETARAARRAVQLKRARLLEKC